jgi:sugar phosphate isomerase/epimerase
VKECLKPIVEHAAAKNVRLGIEGRRGYEEIPSEREIPSLLDELNSPQTGYWHDFGHIQIKENLGFVDHAEWLRTIGPRDFWLSRPGLHLAGAGSSTSVRGRHQS